MNRCIVGDCRDVLPTLEAGSVQTCVTSPPYFGLRSYGIGAENGEIGLEASPNEYIAKMVAVFREVRRVLRDDGTLWLNLGDSYASAWVCNRRSQIGSGSLENGKRTDRSNRLVEGLKEKDLMGIPWRVAFALRADGWVLRQEIIWHKPNPMPESVKDRCTKSHEQIFLFAKAKWSGPENGRFAHISDQDARWLACCIDTEGCIVVKRVKQLDGGADSFAPQIAFGSTSRALIDTFVAITGHGNALERPGKNTPMFYWQISNNVARDFLHRIYPWLIVKKRQARVGIYLDSLTYYRGGKFLDRKQRSAAENAILVSLWERSKMLNKFGNPDLSDVPEPVYGRWADCERYYFDANAIKEDCVQDESRPTFRGGAYCNNSTFNNSEGGKSTDTGNIRRSWNGSEFHTGKTAEHQLGRSQKVRKPAGWDTGPGAHGTIHRDGRAQEVEYSDIDLSKRNKRSVWTVSTKPYTEAHFATFPPDLIEPCILAGSKPGDLVLDPFGGSGTTGMVAESLGRNWLLIELNPAYETLSRERTAQQGMVFA